MNEQMRAELESIRKLKVVTRMRGAMSEADIPRSLERINVGVAFRTDGRGQAHVTHDCKAIECLNGLKNRGGTRLFPFDVVPVTLPRGASGEVTPQRRATWSDLDDIHLLYIPGGPTANDTQEGSSSTQQERDEERNVNRLSPPSQIGKPSEVKKKNQTYERSLEEHVSRAAYELRLLGIARNRGIPILAICAGSWRLLESYGGKVRTLEVIPRGKHKATNPSEVWNLQHDMKLLGGKQLIRLMEAKRRAYESRVPWDGSIEGQSMGVSGFNSTHWAVASTTRTPEIRLTSPEGETRVLVNAGPHQLASGVGNPSSLLEISAMDPDTDTVEAFESLYGAPTMGIQWHPESYLPGMLGEGQGTSGSRALSIALFELMVLAGHTTKRRLDLCATLNLEGRAFDLLCTCARSMALKQLVGAGNAYRGATQSLPKDRWSARMLAVDAAIDVLGESMTEEEANRMVAAGNLYRDAQSRLREYGVTI